ncbi:MAG TPA: hypothetical protein VGO45_11600 [Bacteroidia bacterium]|nr:hypothetical protein [Bacteroidia bacterium]
MNANTILNIMMNTGTATITMNVAGKSLWNRGGKRSRKVIGTAE